MNNEIFCTLSLQIAAAEIRSHVESQGYAALVRPGIATMGGAMYYQVAADLNRRVV
jgi:hypothetical protein